MKIAITIILMLIFVNVSYAKNATKSPLDQLVEEFKYEKVMAPTNVDSQNKLRDMITIKKIENEKFYVMILAVMSLFSLVVSLYLLKNSSPSSKDIVVVTGLNFVVFGSIISIVIVSTTEQLGAVTGIFGALGGYLFGTWDNKPNDPV